MDIPYPDTPVGRIIAEEAQSLMQLPRVPPARLFESAEERAHRRALIEERDRRRAEIECSTMERIRQLAEAGDVQAIGFLHAMADREERRAAWRGQYDGDF
ncbi:MAG TPA: hypothetical protein VNK67_12110 [Burkholderiales bacterium]|nr:hypothetical protein [Burkholderiales bacterium]